MKKILSIFTLIVLLNASFALASSNFISRDRISFKEETDAVSCEDVLMANTVLTSDLTCAGDGLIIGANGITLDCDGHSITYSTISGGAGIHTTSYGSDNLIIKNCNLIKGSWQGDWTAAIDILASSNVLIENNNILAENLNECVGIASDSLYNSIIQNNNIIVDEGVGILLSPWSEENEYLNNTIFGDGDLTAFYFFSRCPNNLIQDNTIEKAQIGISLHPMSGYSSDNLIISNNYMGDISQNELVTTGQTNNIVLKDQSIEKYSLIDTNIIVKKTNLGEVWFDEKMTVSGENLDEDIKIEDNNISIDIVNKPAFNVSGSIVFYNPQTFAFGPLYIPLKNGMMCNNPFHLNVCTDFEYEASSETFSFDVSEMAESFKVDGTYLPIPRITANPDFGPVGSSVDTNISWFFANVGDEFTIMFDDYEVGSFIYPELNYPLENSFIVSIVVPSMPTGEYEVNLKEEGIGNDIFTVTSSSCGKEVVEEVKVVKEVVIEKREVKKIVKIRQDVKRKVAQVIIPQEIKPKTILSSNNKAFYSFYI